ncbi:unnamed protein product [Rotaria socialis]|uniref:Uncharacterized protein n=2 Tax=Rotaria TaxID=231623 RepID=A0A818EQA9_9BILA|nr:unnamed protein product [Rotaria socialis]CAF3436563.1 unnamed protein product [Rotaria socialis]CAF3462513.1 unnamed protein product [Rotaria socialis]
MPFERHAWFRNRYTEPSIVLYNSHKSYIWLWKLSVLLKIVAKTTNWDATFVRIVEKMLARILLTTNLAGHG